MKLDQKEQRGIKEKKLNSKWIMSVGTGTILLGITFIPQLLPLSTCGSGSIFPLNKIEKENHFLGEYK